MYQLRQSAVPKHQAKNGNEMYSSSPTVLASDLLPARVSQTPAIERLAPVHMVEESILLPVDPLFRHPACRQEY